MNHHQEGGLTFARRGEMVRAMIESTLSPAAAATGREGRLRRPTPVPGREPARERSRSHSDPRKVIPAELCQREILR